ncbi:hypothetical protein [Metaclostridioides mangenotii]|uniref:hypothetical protein n=1 Tax=Metaclostridioides mangenotii TaxID=1540 RepID=UPI000AD4D4DB|nr:hypothetical protein [Clostridioides mangenotii]
MAVNTAMHFILIIYMGTDPIYVYFFKEIYIKGDIVEQLEKHLRSPKWNREKT